MGEPTPHLEYLRLVHADVIAQAGLPQPNFAQDQTGETAYKIEEGAGVEFVSYYKHLRQEGYLPEIYDEYACVFDDRLDLRVPKRGQAAAIWTLASIARGVGRLQFRGENSGDVSATEIMQLSIVNTDPHMLVPVLVRLHNLGVIGVNSYDGLGDEPEKLNRYYLTRPQQGHGRIEKRSGPRGGRRLKGIPRLVLNT